MGSKKQNKVSKVIMQIIGDGFDEEGNLKDLDTLEQQYGVSLNCPMLFSQSLGAFRNWYKQIASLHKGGNGIDTSHVITCVPIKKNIQVTAYQKMVQAVLFGDVASYSIVASEKHMLGDIPLPIYFAAVLLISATCKRNPKVNCHLINSVMVCISNHAAFLSYLG